MSSMTWDSLPVSKNDSFHQTSLCARLSVFDFVLYMTKALQNVKLLNNLTQHTFALFFSRRYG
jgi:hypothetical protein